MKTCSFCRQENDDSAVICKHCGTHGFAAPQTSPAGASTTPPPPPPPAWSGVRNSIVEIDGGFRLRQAGGGRQKVISSLGGLKQGRLDLGSQTLILEQRLGTAGVFLLAFLGLPLGMVMFGLVFLALAGGNEKDPGPAVIISLAGCVLLPLACNWWLRRFRCELRLADVLKAEVRDKEIELYFRSAVTVPSALAVEGLMFHPRQASGMEYLQRVLAGAGIEVGNPGAVEQADFVLRLAAATPKAWVTPVLLGLNVAVFILVALASGTVNGPSMLQLLAYGADFGPLTVNGHQWWRLLTSCFLHASILHLAFNMYAFFQAGRLTEKLLGNGFFLTLYLGCGLAASLTSVWFNPAQVSVGASGAIFGVYGALLGWMLREGGGLPRSITHPVVNSALVFIVYNVFTGVMDAINHAAQATINSVNPMTGAHGGGPVIDVAAHGGGLVAGFIFGWLGARPLAISRRQPLTTPRGAGLSLGIALILALLLIPVMAANHLDSVRAKLLGGMYYRGEGVSKNPPAALRWFEQAAEQGDLDSQKLLGAMYWQGDGVSQDSAEAVRWFSLAGEQGDVTAYKTMAGIYLTGMGVPTNVVEGLKWAAKAADLGDLPTQEALAESYLNGIGVEKNLTDGLKWARQAGRQGDLKFQLLLAGWYQQGAVVERDLSEAADWYRLAANQGDQSAQKQLGLMAANGQGANPDPVEGLEFLILCGSQDDEVNRATQTLAAQMSPAQIQQARDAASRYKRMQARRQSN